MPSDRKKQDAGQSCLIAGQGGPQLEVGERRTYFALQDDD